MEPSPFDDLPRAYRIGLRLHALGADDALIADCLDIYVESIGALLEIGAQKFEHAKRDLVASTDPGLTEPEQP
jgi:hypothetical protein